MLAYLFRQRVVGGMIVLLACALCLAPIVSQGQAEPPTPSGSDLLARAAEYPYPDAAAAPRASSASIPAVAPLPAVSREALPDHIVESRSFSLVSTKYRLSPAKAKALVQFLEEQIGRPEVFEVSIEEPEVITIIASPSAQKTIGELLGLMRTSPAKSQPKEAASY
jgi:hypothetical protein